MLKAGTQTLLVTFTPAGATDYTTATATVMLTVNSVTPTVKVTPSALSVTTAQVLAVPVTVNGEHANPNKTTAAKVDSPVGTYPIKIARGPL